MTACCFELKWQETFNASWVVMFGFGAKKRSSSRRSERQDASAIVAVEPLSFPFECESPFLFAVYHLDRYPPGNEKMGPAASLRGRNIGSDFGHPSGWSMYHGEEVPGFPKHPHRGFETITITRQGIVDHADSLGCAARFGHGDVQWMTAGSGINHAEMFSLLNRETENSCELFQVWINLPRSSKMADPSFKMFWAEDLPKAPAVADGVEVALIAGEMAGFGTPPAPPPDSYASDPASDVLVLTLKLAAGSSWTLPGYTGSGSTETLNRNLYFYAGKQVIVAGRQLDKHARIKVQPGTDVTIAAGAGAAEILVLQGRDIGEPVVQHGPFVGNTRQDIVQAFTDYQRTGFGRWPWPSDSPSHPRDRPRFAKYGDGRIEEKPLPA